MYRLITKQKETYILTDQEAAAVQNFLQSPSCPRFLNLTRHKKLINTYEICLVEHYHDERLVVIVSDVLIEEHKYQSKQEKPRIIRVNSSWKEQIAEVTLNNTSYLNGVWLQIYNEYLSLFFEDGAEIPNKPYLFTLERLEELRKFIIPYEECLNRSINSNSFLQLS